MNETLSFEVGYKMSDNGLWEIKFDHENEKYSDKCIINNHCDTLWFVVTKH